MPYSERLANRIRKALATESNVEEKKMFGSLGFMVNGKLCVTAGPTRMLCRISPKLHEKIIKKEGCNTVVMKGREYKGYIHIDEAVLKTDSELQNFIDLALAHNQTLG